SIDLSKLACLFLHRVAWLILECARRTRPFRGRAFREQEDDQAALLPPSEPRANSCLLAVFCSHFLSKSWARAYSFPNSLGQLHKTLLYFNQFRSPFFLVMRLVLALHSFRASLTSIGVDHVVPDVSDVPVVTPPPGSRSPGARGTDEGLRPVA